MIEIDFYYKGIKTTIQCNINDKVKNIIQKFSTKANIDINNLFFLYNGEQLDEELTFNDQASRQDKERKIMSILVHEECETIINENFKKSKDIICPACKEPIRIRINN